MDTIRVLVVDDSAVTRRLVVEALATERDMRVVATAANGHDALAHVDGVDPDVVVLDVEMPGLDGLAVLRLLRARRPGVRVVMFSVATRRGAEATLAALRHGAADCVQKPAAASREKARELIAAELAPRIRALGTPAPAATSFHLAPPERSAPRAVVVAASTGGPDALERMLGALPADLPVPVFLVQHMPAVFTRLFAARLDRTIGLAVREAEDGDVAVAGTVYVAPGGRHLALVPNPDADRDGGDGANEDVLLVVHDAPPEQACRPAADVLFNSAARVYGRGALGVVLSGMGRDGLVGSRGLRASHGRVLVQNRESSVVWSMPGAVAAEGLAEAADTPEGLADRILATVAAREAR